MNGGCHCIQNVADHITVDTCLFFQLAIIPGLISLDWKTIEIGVKKNIQFSGSSVVISSSRLNDLILDHVALCDRSLQESVPHPHSSES